MVDVASGAAKVIDPEFCVYGPPGLDVGSLVSGMGLAVITHVFKPQPDALAAKSMVDAIEHIWDTYASILVKEKLSAAVVKRISEDAVGFACCEVARTALGFAGARGLKFEDKDKEGQAQDAVLALARHCILGARTAETATLAIITT